MKNSNLVNVVIPANSNNYKVGRSGYKIKYITIHHMAGVLTAEQCGNIFKNGNRQTSSHYGIGKDGSIGQYVDEANTAYANGNWKANCEAITIEISNSSASGNYPVSNITLNKAIQLIADIAKRNNLGKLEKGKNLTWHRMYKSTTCPGEYLLSKIDYIVAEANKIILESKHNSNKKSSEEIANEVIKGLWGNGEERKKKLQEAGYDYNYVQNIINNKLKK